MSEKEKQLKGRAKGHNGIIEYELDIDNDRIDDLKILKHSETSGIFNQVIDKLKDRVISQQSFDVDAVSGATVMTKAILESAKQVAENNQLKLHPVTIKKQAPKIERLKADVVVIGGGEAGLVAACRSLSLGQKVILVEKNGYLGGATILNGSNVTGTGSEIAKTIFGDNGDTPQKLADDVRRESRNTNIPQLTNLMVQNIGPAIDFISQFAGLHYQKAQTQTPEHSIDRQIELPSASSYEFIQKVGKAFESRGGQILLGARVEELLYNGQHEVNGLIAKSSTTTYKVKAGSVVLASGGYGANQQMRTPDSKGINYYGPMTSTGDAYAFNQPLSLKSHDLDWYKVYPHGVQVEPGIAKLTTYASKKATDMGAIYVNTNGRRIVNESDVYAKFRDAIMEQRDRMAYVLMDERTWQEFYNLLVMHDFTENEIKAFFDAPTKRPIFVKGSLKDVCEQSGVAYENLKATLTGYEKMVTAGVDSEFHRDPQYLHHFEGETFYLVEQTARFATTLGGYSADPTDLHLVSQDQRDVANYFGAGEVIGGANGHDSMPSMMNTWGISSGYVAGKAASQNANRRKVTADDQDKKILGIVGTNASKSYNRKLLNAVRNLFEDQVDFDIAEIKDLPLFNEDLVDDEPLIVKALAHQIEDADGVVIAVPEYDHAIPAALKSMIEWLSCAEHPFKNKPVMIVGTSLGIQGTVRAQMNLRQILDAPGVDANIMPGHEFMLPKAGEQFDEDGQLTDMASRDFLKQCFEAFITHIDRTVEVEKQRIVSE